MIHHSAVERSQSAFVWGRVGSGTHTFVGGGVEGAGEWKKFLGLFKLLPRCPCVSRAFFVNREKNYVRRLVRKYETQVVPVEL